MRYARKVSSEPTLYSVQNTMNWCLVVKSGPLAVPGLCLNVKRILLMAVALKVLSNVLG